MAWWGKRKRAAARAPCSCEEETTPITHITIHVWTGHHLLLRNEGTMARLKQQIAEELGTPVGHQLLTHRGSFDDTRLSVGKRRCFDLSLYPESARAPNLILKKAVLRSKLEATNPILAVMDWDLLAPQGRVSPASVAHLKDLAQANSMILCLVSNNRSTVELVHLNGLRDCFDFISCGSSVKKKRLFYGLIERIGGMLTAKVSRVRVIIFDESAKYLRRCSASATARIQIETVLTSSARTALSSLKPLDVDSKPLDVDSLAEALPSTNAADQEPSLPPQSPLSACCAMDLEPQLATPPSCCLARPPAPRGNAPVA
eukprot:CAMPEP_0175953610 /NCGR_PEP_ID=MMETSP0108-20121206/31451_1 /TAXON_ID=195067 ORGANISM="Goniomonas pacifica, Strain CCMP1869" /NCGR_SAMPLE_ID=MMETSP0108 /ASSEMBLY_ACC=CAM_ASM_000204 /LENGTH=315 /DNA_ID=CAMNT_0017280199 /DNA_START=16 /DNA_END=963 /DNA_ORIENTATION=+